MDMDDENFKAWSQSITKFIEQYQSGLRSVKSRGPVSPGEIFRNIFQNINIFPHFLLADISATGTRESDESYMSFKIGSLRVQYHLGYLN